MVPGDDALEQETRRRIFDHVAAHPGQHMRELQRQLAMSAGTLEYHLHVLVREGLLAERRQGRYVRYFVAAQVGRQEKDVLGLLRQAVPRKLCALLLMHPDQSHGELLRQFQLAPSTLTFHMKKLTEAGLVEARREGRETRYKVAQPDVVGRILVEYKASFLDDVVDRFADVFLSMGGGLEPREDAAGGGGAPPPEEDKEARPSSGGEGAAPSGAPGGAGPGGAGERAGQAPASPGSHREGKDPPPRA